MATFRNSKTNYSETNGKEILSEEYTHEEQVIKGQKHIIGTKKTISLCDDKFAEEHFPDPKDYNLKNLIESGANIQEVTSEIEPSEEYTMEQAEILNQTIETENNNK